MKFCKDCTYFKMNDAGMAFARCMRTLKHSTDMVSGEAITLTEYCDVERKDFKGRCGPKATHWSCKKCADSESYCSDECYQEAAKEHEWIRGLSQGAVTGEPSEEEIQDMRDAGRIP